MDRFDVIVIGQGYAGLSAAKLANQNGLRTANLEAKCMGGLILGLNDLDPAPSEGHMSGADLSSNVLMANMESGVECLSSLVTSLARNEDGLWVVSTNDDAYLASHVIAASGATLRKLGVPGEAEYSGLGVSECADCDGPLYNGKAVVVVGGGDSAFQEAIALTQYADTVTMVMRSNAPRARVDLVEQARTNPKIKQSYNAVITEVMGEPGTSVTGVRLEGTGSGSVILPCAAIFVYVGLRPSTDFLPESARRDCSGALIVDGNGNTGAPGLWAIGAVRSGFGGTLEDAANDASRAVTAILTSINRSST